MGKIRQMKDDMKRRMEEERLAQLDRFREDYIARGGQEDLLRTRTDQLVAKMEKEEMELIHRLQNTQGEQRSAYEELENALSHAARGQPAGSTNRQASRVRKTR